MDPVVEVLEVYGNIRDEVAKSRTQVGLAYDAKGIEKVIDLVHNPAGTDIENELLKELALLEDCKVDLLALQGSLEKEKNDEMTTEGTLKEAEALRFITHPGTKKEIQVQILDFKSLLTDSVKNPSQVITILVEASKNLQKLLVLQERHHGMVAKQYEANEQRLRDELFVSKRRLIAHMEQLEGLEAMGISIYMKQDAEDRQNEDFEEFRAAKAKIQTLEKTLTAAKSMEKTFKENLEKAHRSMKIKSDENLLLQSNIDSLMSKLALASSEIEGLNCTVRSLKAEAGQIRSTFASLYPEASSSLTTCQFAEENFKAVSSLRSAVLSVSDSINTSGCLLPSEELQVRRASNKVHERRKSSCFNTNVFMPPVPKSKKSAVVRLSRFY